MLAALDAQREILGLPPWQGDLAAGPLGAACVAAVLAALDAGERGFQRTRQSPQAGIAGHDLDQGGG